MSLARKDMGQEAVMPVSLLSAHTPSGSWIQALSGKGRWMNCPLECKPFFVSPLQFFDSKIVQEVSASLFASNILGGNQGGIKNIYKYFIKLFYMVIFLIQTSLQSLLPFMGTYRKSPPPSKYFLGFASGLRLRMWVSVKGIFATSTLLDNLIPTWTNLPIFQHVAFVGIGN